MSDGGPAFPFDYTQNGMSLRDYFAAKALMGLIPSSGGPYFGTVGKPHDPWPSYATEAYRAADAMLKARNEAEESGGGK